LMTTTANSVTIITAKPADRLPMALTLEPEGTTSEGCAERPVVEAGHHRQP